MQDITERYIAMAEDTKKRLDEHLVEYSKDRAEYLEGYKQLKDLQQANAEAIGQLITSTQGLVDVWTVANGFQRFFKWLSGFAVASAAVVWLITNIKWGELWHSLSIL